MSELEHERPVDILVLAPAGEDKADSDSVGGNVT